MKRVTQNEPEDSKFEEFVIEKTSKIPVNVNTDTTGNYIIMVSDTTPGGTNAIFVCSKSVVSHEAIVSRISSSRGTEGQSISADWLPNETVKIYHHIIGSGEGHYTYRAKVYSAI